MCTEGEYKVQAELARLTARFDAVVERLDRQSDTIGRLRDDVKDLRHEDAQGDVKHVEHEQRIKNLERVAYGASAAGGAALLGHLPALITALSGG